jgi:putative sigma-54 modulation protein
MRGKVLHAESIGQDLYAAVDTLIDKLDRQVIKYKSKLKDNRHVGIKTMQEAPEEGATA